MKNLQLMLTGREVSKAENKKGLSQATTLTPDKVSTTARLWLDYGSSTARVWKYAAMLLMLLTLGVGEMWGM